MLAPPASFASGAGNASDVTVLVFNFRHVPRHALAAAENESTRIFEQAGIRVTWRDCPTGNEPCQIAPGRVLLLSLATGPVQNHSLDTISGYALLSDRLAVVYYDYLPRIPNDESGEDNVGVVLGCVITHELGHLLLGTTAHSAGGIMKARWGVEEMQEALMSQLRFLPEEARLMGSETPKPTRTPPVSALTSH